MSARPSSNGAIPPHDLDAEAAVLSSVMLDDEALARVDFLAPEHFYAEAHRRVFEACRELASKRQPVDVVQVATCLRSRGRLAQVGGSKYLAEILNSAPRVANVAAYAQTVQQKARVREAIATHQRLAAEGYVETVDAQRWLEVSAAELRRQADAGAEARPSETATPIVNPSSIIAAWETEGPLVHELTDLATLDRLTDGGPVYGSRWYIVGAPDAGKTALLVQLADVFARRGIAVGLLMADEEPGDATMRLVQRAGFSREECERRDPIVLCEMRGALEGLPIRLYGPEHTIESAAEDLAAFAKARGSRAMLGVDSIQTVTSSGGRILGAVSGREPSPREIVGANVRALRDVATRHKMFAVATSEMNRGAYKGDDAGEATNDMAAAKESGAIEYSARVMLSLRSVKDEPDLLELRVAKNKHGPSWRKKEHSINLRLDRMHMQLTETAAPEKADDESRSSKRTAALEKDAHAALRILLAHPGVGARDLRAHGEAAGLGRERLERAVAHLILTRRAEDRTETVGRRQDHHFYATGAA